MNVLLPLCFKAVVDADLVDLSHLTSDSVVLVGWEGRGQRGVFRDLLGSPACMNSDGAGSSRVKLSEENEGFDPEGGDVWMEIVLDDEPESLLDSLNAWQEKVTAGSF